MNDSPACPFCLSELTKLSAETYDQCGHHYVYSWYEHPANDCFAADVEIDALDSFMLNRMAVNHGQDNPALKMAYLAVIIYPPHMRSGDFWESLMKAAEYANEEI